MRIAVTGSSGLVGGALLPALRVAGHDPVRLVRHEPAAADEVRWAPGERLDPNLLAGVEAAVHLAGAGIGDRRWTEDYKRQVHDSRVLGTRTLVQALTRLDPLPRVLICGSAVGYYGSRGDEELTERSAPGTGFVPGMVQEWEAEAAPAQDAGIRVASIRSALVMAPHGGAFGRLLPLIRLGLGGPLGSGRQWWPWITLEDEVAAICFLLERDVAGPVNLAAPDQATNRAITRALGRAMGRPTVLPAPDFALRVVLGEFAGEILASQRVRPERLLAEGFTFAHPTLDEAAAWTVAGR